MSGTSQQKAYKKQKLTWDSIKNYMLSDDKEDYKLIKERKWHPKKEKKTRSNLFLLYTSANIFFRYVTLTTQLLDAMTVVKNALYCKRTNSEGKNIVPLTLGTFATDEYPE